MIGIKPQGLIWYIVQYCFWVVLWKWSVFGSCWSGLDITYVESFEHKYCFFLSVRPSWQLLTISTTGPGSVLLESSRMFEIYNKPREDTSIIFSLPGTKILQKVCTISVQDDTEETSSRTQLLFQKGILTRYSDLQKNTDRSHGYSI